MQRLKLIVQPWRKRLPLLLLLLLLIWLRAPVLD
jgi:hypothetical protein